VHDYGLGGSAELIPRWIGRLRTLARLAPALRR